MRISTRLPRGPCSACPAVPPALLFSVCPLVPPRRNLPCPVCPSTPKPQSVGVLPAPHPEAGGVYAPQPEAPRLRISESASRTSSQTRIHFRLRTSGRLQGQATRQPTRAISRVRRGCRPACQATRQRLTWRLSIAARVRIFSWSRGSAYQDTRQPTRAISRTRTRQLTKSGRLANSPSRRLASGHLAYRESAPRGNGRRLVRIAARNCCWSA